MSKFRFRKKIENIGKMTQMTQEEIVTNTKTVLQGLEALRVEHLSIIAGLSEDKKDPDKSDIISKNIESIELGLGEAQVRILRGSIFNPDYHFNNCLLGNRRLGIAFAKH